MHLRRSTRRYCTIAFLVTLWTLPILWYLLSLSGQRLGTRWIHNGSIDETFLFQVFKLNESPYGATTPRQRRVFLNLMDTASDALTKANVTFFLTGGSLIGSWRHHGFVPWDDDFDLVILEKELPTIFEALKKLDADYDYVARTLGDIYKSISFFSKKLSFTIPGFSWKWPFLDLCVHRENATHIWHADTVHYPEEVFPKTMVYPVRKRPFEGRFVPVPYQTEEFLRTAWNPDECVAGTYDHRYERVRLLVKILQPKLDCASKMLQERFPFVHRQAVSSGKCNETLMLNGTEISSWCDPDQRC